MIPSSIQNLFQRFNVALAEGAVGFKAVSFASIGVINTIVDAGVFFLAIGYLTSSLIVANVLGWIVGVTCSYVLNSHFTFARESGRQLRWRDYATFAASGIIGVVANTAMLVFAAQYAPVWVAKGLAILVSFAVNFSLSHFVVFRARDGAAGEQR